MGNFQGRASTIGQSIGHSRRRFVASGLSAAALLATCRDGFAAPAGLMRLQDTEQTLNVMEGETIGDRLGGSGWHGSGLAHSLLFRALLLPATNLVDVEPDLVTEYEVSDDNLTFTATLRDDVIWQDGEPVTVDDVVWSMQTVLQSAQALSLFIGTFSLLDGAEEFLDGGASEIRGLTTDGNTITMKLLKPVGDLLPTLAQFMIFPKHLLENSDPLQIHNDPFWSAPVGNGMYQIKEFNAGNFITMEPSEAYEGTPPKIQEVVFIGSTDPVSDAEAGRLHLFFTNQPDIIRGMEEVPTFEAHHVDVLFYRYFVVNSIDNAVMQDVNVRKAILHAIDREALAKAIYGDVSGVIDSGVPPSHPMYLEDQEHYNYDPELAKQLLDEAGYDYDYKLRLRYYYADDISRTFMTAVTQQLQDLGMNVEVLQFQGDATTELYEIRDYDLALKGLSAFSFREWYSEYGYGNFIKINGEQPEMVEMADRLAELSDPEEQRTVLAEMQTWEQEHLLKLPLFTLAIYQYLSQSVVAPEEPFSNPWWHYDMDFETWEIEE